MSIILFLWKEIIIKKLFLGLKVLMFGNSLGEKILIPMVNTTQMGVIN